MIIRIRWWLGRWSFSNYHVSRLCQCQWPQLRHNRCHRRIQWTTYSRCNILWGNNAMFLKYCAKVTTLQLAWCLSSLERDGITFVVQRRAGPEKGSDYNVDQMVNAYTMYATRQNISLKRKQTNSREEERMTRDWPEINWPRLAVKQGLQVGGRRLSITLLIIGGLHGSLPLVPSLHSLPQDKGKIFRGILTFSTKQCVALKEVAKVYGAKWTRYPLCTKFFSFRRLSLTSIKWVLQPNQVRRAVRPLCRDLFYGQEKVHLADQLCKWGQMPHNY